MPHLSDYPVKESTWFSIDYFKGQLFEFAEFALVTKLADGDANVGKKQIQGFFKDFVQFLAKFKDFQGLENEQIF